MNGAPRPGLDTGEIQRRQDLARRRLEVRRARRSRIRRRRAVAVLLVVGLAAGLWALVGRGEPSRTRQVVARSHAAEAELTSLVRTRSVVPGHLGAFPWPAAGQAAVAVVGAGLMARSPGGTGPIASLTKMMTALLILHDHPLAPGSSGPRLVMGPADVAAYVTASQTDESNVPIRRGEVLSEYQLLEAMLMPSADNVAERLAVWDAGTLSKFIAKMNAKASTLGLTGTHYTDASGVDPSSRSTAADQALLAAELLENPVVRKIVDQPSVPFPVAGTIFNVNPALGVDGIVGVKSGYTSQAEGCLATAEWVRRGSGEALVVAVTLHQPDGLYGAARVDEGLLSTAASELVTTGPVSTSAPVVRVSVPWSTVVTTAHLARPALVLGWPGMRYTMSFSPRPAHAASGVVGVALVTTSAGVLTRVPLIADDLPAIPSGWSPPGG